MNPHKGWVVSPKGPPVLPPQCCEPCLIKGTSAVLSQYYHKQSPPHHVVPIMCACVLAASGCLISWPDTPIVFRSDGVHHLITTSPLILFYNAFLVDQSVSYTHTVRYSLCKVMCNPPKHRGRWMLKHITTGHLNTVHGAPHSVCRCVSYGSK
jgi:hypothetical protein